MLISLTNCLLVKVIDIFRNAESAFTSHSQFLLFPNKVPWETQVVCIILSYHLCLLIMEREILIEKLPPPDWAMRMSMGEFSWWIIKKKTGSIPIVSAISGLDLYKKVGEHEPHSILISSIPQSLHCQVPAGYPKWSTVTCIMKWPLSSLVGYLQKQWQGN